jgi:hypothetical protein
LNPLALAREGILVRHFLLTPFRGVSERILLMRLQFYHCKS